MRVLSQQVVPLFSCLLGAFILSYHTSAQGLTTGNLPALHLSASLSLSRKCFLVQFQCEESSKKSFDWPSLYHMSIQEPGAGTLWLTAFGSSHVSSSGRQVSGRVRDMSLDDNDTFSLYILETFPRPTDGGSASLALPAPVSSDIIQGSCIPLRSPRKG